MKNPLFFATVLILATIVVGINSCTLVCGCVQGPDFVTVTIRSVRDSTSLAVEVDSLEVKYIVKGQTQTFKKKDANGSHELMIIPENNRVRLMLFGIVPIARDKAVNDFTLEWRGRTVATLNVKIVPANRVGDYSVEAFRINNILTTWDSREIEIPNF